MTRPAHDLRCNRLKFTTENLGRWICPLFCMEKSSPGHEPSPPFFVWKNRHLARSNPLIVPSNENIPYSNELKWAHKWDQMRSQMSTFSYEMSSNEHTQTVVGRINFQTKNSHLFQCKFPKRQYYLLLTRFLISFHANLHYGNIICKQQR